MTKKMFKDNPGSDPAEALDACLAAKKCTINAYGCSPIQLAFEFAPTIPYFPSNGADITDEEQSLVSKGYLKDRLQRMKGASILAIGVMAKQRIKRALQHPVRANVDSLHVGDKVDWYTVHSLKTGTGEWKGPGQLGLLHPPMAMVLAGGRMIPTHVTHVRHTLVDTGLDVDGRESIEQNDSVERPERDGDAVDTPMVHDAGPRDVAEGQDVPVESEEQELTGAECV